MKAKKYLMDHSSILSTQKKLRKLAFYRNFDPADDVKVQKEIRGDYQEFVIEPLDWQKSDEDYETQRLN